MSKDLFSQNVIAVIWDFDKTLIPDYMQVPLFRYYGIDSKAFWREVSHLPDYYRKKGVEFISKDTIYLNHILTYVQKNIFKGLNNGLLRELGKEIEFYPGMPEFLNVIRETIANQARFAPYEIHVENYIVSTGLRQMILGSRIAGFVDGIWGCEFVEGAPPPGYLDMEIIPEEKPAVITGIGYAIDNTSKTRAVFEINKGSNKNPDIDVNSSIKKEDRRVPFQNMIYIADGPSDIPVFSLVKQNGGRVFGVYRKGELKEFKQVNNLQKQGRIEAFGEADYNSDSQTYLWVLSAVSDIAEKIVSNQEKMVKEKVAPPPKHLD